MWSIISSRSEIMNTISVSFSAASNKVSNNPSLIDYYWTKIPWRRKRESMVHSPHKLSLLGRHTGYTAIIVTVIVVVFIVSMNLINSIINTGRRLGASTFHHPFLYQNCPQVCLRVSVHEKVGHDAVSNWPTRGMNCCWGGWSTSLAMTSFALSFSK